MLATYPPIFSPWFKLDKVSVNGEMKNGDIDLESGDPGGTEVK